MKRLENLEDSWLKNIVVSAIGGFTVPNAGTRIVFCRNTFEHPDLQSHDYRQDHLGKPSYIRVWSRIMPDFTNICHSESTVILVH